MGHVLDVKLKAPRSMGASNASPESGATVPLNAESKKIVKSKGKGAKCTKKPTPTVIHATNASDFRSLVQQLTSSAAEPLKPSVENPDQSPQPEQNAGLPPTTPKEHEAQGKSRIQTLAPPPLRPTPRIVRPSQSLEGHIQYTRPPPANPPSPFSLSVSRLFSFGSFRGMPSPSFGSFFGGLFTSPHGVGSPGSDFKWRTPMDASDEVLTDMESPGAVAFREALTVMLPPGTPEEMPEVTSTMQHPLGGVQDGAGGEGSAMQIETRQQEGVVQA